jgi:hypothetical protein
MPKKSNGQLLLTDHGFRSAALSRVLSFPFIHPDFLPGYYICKSLINSSWIYHLSLFMETLEIESTRI